MKQDNVDQSWIGGTAIGVIVISILFAVFMCFICSCSPRIIENIVEKEKIVYRDSVQYKDSLIKIPIPLEKDQVIVHLGDTSKLSTSLAKSVAYVRDDGLLHHSLENKKGTFDVPVKIPYRTIWIQLTSDKEKTITKIEYREKDLSWWKRFKLGAFWPLLVGVILMLLWIFRKPITKLLKIC